MNDVNDSSREERYLVVTSDSHVGPLLESYRPYCPKRFINEFDEQLGAVKERRALGLSAAEISERAFGYRWSDPLVAAVDRANLIAGGLEPDARRHDMDGDGVAADVIFHGLQNGEPMPLVAEGLFQSSANGPSALDPVGYHMYNQWLADFISGAPERHAALAYVSFLNIEGAIKELEWARGAGLRGVNFPAPKRDRLDYTDPKFETFFAACAALAMPLVTHNGGGDRWHYNNPTLSMAMQMIEGPFVGRRGLWQLIFSGVFERNPNLKMVLTEFNDVHWVRGILRDMDFAALDPVNPDIWGRLARLPSETWTANCYVGASFMSADEARQFNEVGMSKMMWGSDYPHPEGTHPYTLAAMKNTFQGLPFEDVRQMIGMTAVEAFSLDEARLRPIANRIGPGVDELAAPPEDVPPRSEYVGRAFRESSAWPADGAYAQSLANRNSK